MSYDAWLPYRSQRRLKQPGNLPESVAAMLSLIRMLRNLGLREHNLRTRHHRRHPHFLLFLALDAILSVAIVGGGYAIASTHDIVARNSSVLKQLGALSLSAYSFRKEIRDNGQDAYWVGPASGSRYAAAFPTPAAVEVKYLTTASNEVPLRDPMISITTYNNPADYKLTLKGPIHATGDITTLNAAGEQITYHPSHLTHIAVSIAGSEKLIVLRYAAPQTLSALIAATENLQLVI